MLFVTEISELSFVICKYPSLLKVEVKIVLYDVDV